MNFTIPLSIHLNIFNNVICKRLYVFSRERSELKILFLGDIMGKPGRLAVIKILPEFCHEHGIDFVIANGENLAGGKGVTRDVAGDLFEVNVDVLTGGNHIWQNREGIAYLNEDIRILRPANYPEHLNIPGRGFAVYSSYSGKRVGVMNLQGRIFMSPIDCPFQRAEQVVEILKKETQVILVDFHAEATSEKIAMGWHLDGKVSAVIGTHTHVQTADEQILPQGTAYLTDAGMTGAHDGVIGVKKELVLESMLTRLPIRHKLANGDVQLNGALIEIDPETGKSISIKRIIRSVKI